MVGLNPQVSLFCPVLNCTIFLKADTAQPSVVTCFLSNSLMLPSQLSWQRGRVERWLQALNLYKIGCWSQGWLVSKIVQSYYLLRSWFIGWNTVYNCPKHLFETRIPTSGQDIMVTVIKSVNWNFSYDQNFLLLSQYTQD